MITHDEARKCARIYGENIGRNKKVADKASRQLITYIKALPDHMRSGAVWDLVSYACEIMRRKTA